MKNILIILTLLTTWLYAQETLYVENYTLEDGRYKGSIYTGNIDRNGLPQGKGVIMCKNYPKEIEYEANFINGKIKIGKWISCGTKKDIWSKHGYKIHYEGKFADFEDFSKYLIPNKSKLTLLFPNDDNIHELTGVFEYKPAGFTTNSIKNIIGTLKINNQDITSKFLLTDRLDVTIGKFIIVNRANNFKFDGYLTSTTGGLTVDGLLSWPDGITYKYKGKYDLKKFEKIKKRLDLFKTKTKTKEIAIKTSTPTTKVDIKNEKIKQANIKVDDSKTYNGSSTDSTQNTPIDMK